MKIIGVMALLALVALIHGCKSETANVLYVSHQASAETPELAFKEVNIFAAQVGNVLKTNYPMRIENCGFTLTARKEPPQLYTYNWGCRLVTSPTQAADWMFDRRGYLASNTVSRSDVEQLASTQLEKENSVNIAISKFNAAGYPQPRILSKQVVATDANDAGTFYATAETFFAVPCPSNIVCSRKE